MAAAKDGFEWRPERPDTADFVSQKWGYRGDKIGEPLCNTPAGGACLWQLT